MTLTSRQRVLQTMRREPVDRVAVAPYMYDIAVAATGVSLLDYYTNAIIAVAFLALGFTLKRRRDIDS